MRLLSERYFSHHRADDGRSISRKVASLNIIVYDVLNLLYYELSLNRQAKIFLRIKLTKVGGTRSTCENLDWDACPIFFNSAKPYISVIANFKLFFGFAKFPLYFWIWQISTHFLGLLIFVSHT